MHEWKDPKVVVDSVVDGAVGAAQFFPRAAENVAKVATVYAASANKNLNELKAKMPEDPTVVPQLLLGFIGETVGAGIGMVEAIVIAGSDTAKDVKSQIARVTG